MRKFLALGTCIAALSFAAAPALADGHKGDKGGKFEKHDTNGDGAISKAEFLSHAEERFGKMDANGDGSVSKEEAKAAHKDKREKMKEKRGERKGAAE